MNSAVGLGTSGSSVLLSHHKAFSTVHLDRGVSCNKYSGSQNWRKRNERRKYFPVLTKSKQKLQPLINSMMRKFS